MRRIPHPVMACAAACSLAVILARPAAAQLPVGRLFGSVKDISGQSVRGATVRAWNPGAIPNEFTATSDPKGQWAILGLRAGTWEVTAGAPGFESSTISVRVSALQANPAIQFVLVGAVARGPLEGVDTKQLQADLSAAESLMADRQWLGAAAAYRAILLKVPSLTMVNLPLGRALRMQKDFAGAAAAYVEILKDDPSNQKALLGLGRTQHEQGDRAAALATLEKLVAIDGTTEESAQARGLLEQLRK